MASTSANMGLQVWDQLTDPYDHTQLAANWTKVDQHDHTSGKGLRIPTAGIADGAITSAKFAAGTTILPPDAGVTTAKLADGSVTTAKIADSNVTAIKLADAARLGLSDGTLVRRGKSIIPGPESRTNVAYGLMPTPDRVSGVVLPTDGVIAVMAQMTWQESVAAAGHAAIFIGSNQLKTAAAGSSAPLLMDATIQQFGAVGLDVALASCPRGLASLENFTFAGAYTGDVTTGQSVAAGLPTGSTASVQAAGGPCYIFAAAGTYDVSVQFKATSGSVTAKNRKLWVWTIGF